MTTEHDELRRTAWHEAGHALVGAVEFGNSGTVTIVPDGKVLGRQITERSELFSAETYAARLSTNPVYVASLARGAIRHRLAGRAAEAILLGRLPRRFVGDTDMQEAMPYAWLAAKQSPRAERPALWFFVLDPEWRRVRRFLRLNLRCLRALATALLSKQTLSGDDVDTIICQHKLIRPKLRGAGGMKELKDSWAQRSKGPLETAKGSAMGAKRN